MPGPRPSPTVTIPSASSRLTAASVASCLSGSPSLITKSSFGSPWRAANLRPTTVSAAAMSVLPSHVSGNRPSLRRAGPSITASHSSSSRTWLANDHTAAGTPMRRQTSVSSTVPSKARSIRTPWLIEAERSTSSRTAGSRRWGRTGRHQSERYAWGSASNCIALRSSSRGPHGCPPDHRIRCRGTSIRSSSSPSLSATGAILLQAAR